MPSKSAPKRKTAKDTPAKQSARFIETARALGADEDPKAFDKAFKKIASTKK